MRPEMKGGAYWSAGVMAVCGIAHIVDEFMIVVGGWERKQERPVASPFLARR